MVCAVTISKQHTEKLGPKTPTKFPWWRSATAFPTHGPVTSVSLWQTKLKPPHIFFLKENTYCETVMWKVCYVLFLWGCFDTAWLPWFHRLNGFSNILLRACPPVSFGCSFLNNIWLPPEDNRWAISPIVCAIPRYHHVVCRVYFQITGTFFLRTGEKNDPPTFPFHF